MGLEWIGLLMNVAFIVLAAFIIGAVLHMVIRSAVLAALREHSARERNSRAAAMEPGD